MVFGEINREQRRRRNRLMILIVGVILIGLSAFVCINKELTYFMMASMILLVEYVASAVFLRMKMNRFNSDAFKSEKSSVNN